MNAKFSGLNMRGNADEHSRFHQQGFGVQNNLSLVYVNPDQTPLPWRESEADWPTVRELDPLDLGVHRSEVGGGNAVPEYIPRDVDYLLDESLRRAAVRGGGFVLLVGPSTAGKSRAAYQAALREFPESRVIIPLDTFELQQASVRVVGSAETKILWLENLENFLGPDGLSPALIRHLRRHDVVTIGTLRSEVYQRIRAGYPDISEDHTHGPNFDDGYVLDIAETLVVDRRWSNIELERAGSSRDARIVEALRHTATYGVAEYLAAGPRLLEEWKLAWGAGGRPRGAAIVAAAVDLVRVGLTSPLPLSILESLHETYLLREGGELLRPESLEEALRWAARRRFGVTSLLLPTDKETFRAFDYLVDAAERTSQPIPDATWREALEYSSSDKRRLFSIGLSARALDQAEIAEQAWTSLAALGSAVACYYLGQHRRKTDKSAAEEWFRQGAEKGDALSATSLGLLLENRDDFTGAEKWFRVAANAGSKHGTYHLALILEEKNKLGEAEELLRKVLDWDSSTVALPVAEGVEEEISRFAAKNEPQEDSAAAASSLAYLLEQLGRAEEAHHWWKQASGSDQPHIWLNLGLNYLRRNLIGKARESFEAAATLGDEKATAYLGIVALHEGKTSLGKRLLTESQDLSDHTSLSNVGRQLLRLKLYGEAEPWLRRSVEHGNDKDVDRLASTLDHLNRSDEAEPLWLRAAQDGNSNAAYQVAMIAKDRGDYTEAEAWFRAGYLLNHPGAACELGRIVIMRDREGEDILRRSLELGHVHAGCALGGHIMREEGRSQEAEQLLRQAYEGGHTHAGAVLEALLLREGRGREAAKLHRKLGGEVSHRSKKSNGPRGKRRRK